MPLQLLALSPECLDAALDDLAAELHIQRARAVFMVSKAPHLLFMGERGAALLGNCICLGDEHNTDSRYWAEGGTTSRQNGAGAGAGNSSKAMAEESKPSCRAVRRGMRAGSMDSRGGGGSSSSSSSSSSKGGVYGPDVDGSMHHNPSVGPAMRAATLAHMLGVPPDEVVQLAASAPSVLSRPLLPLAAKIKRLAEELDGLPVTRLLRMAAEQPSYLTYRPPAIGRRVQVCSWSTCALCSASKPRGQVP